MSATFADRRAMIAKVHIAKKDLQLDDTAYGEVLERVTGEPSARSLTRPQLEGVLREFKRLGWAPQLPPGKRSHKANVRMIYGIWADLQPHLHDGSRDALRSFVRRQTRSRLAPDGIAAPEFLDAKGANLVIEGLKAWLRRVRLEAGAREGAKGAKETADVE